jgi:hypothetical protein
MGYLTLLAPCAGCGHVFTANPFRVPSVRVAGERQPICRQCVDRANVHLIATDRPPIVPLPGAYDPAPHDLDDDDDRADAAPWN